MDYKDCCAEIIIFEENNQLHHARVTNKRFFWGGDSWIIGYEYIYPMNVDKKVSEIMRLYNANNFSELMARNIAKVVDYSTLSDYEKREEGKERIMQKNQALEAKRNLTIGSRWTRNNSYVQPRFKSRAPFTINKINKKIKKLNIGAKNIAIYGLVAVVIIGGSFVLIQKPIRKHHASAAIEQVVESVDDKLTFSKNDLENLLYYLDEDDKKNDADLKFCNELCKKIFDDYINDKKNNYIDQALKRYEFLGGFKNIRNMERGELQHLCQYLVTLIIQGDDYNYQGSAMSGGTAAALTKDNKDDLYEAAALIAKDANVPTVRVEYAATQAENTHFYSLPLFMKYFILCKAETAIKEAKFEFPDNLKPTWWRGAFESNNYTYEKLIEIITEKKEICINRIYEEYCPSEKKRR